MFRYLFPVFKKYPQLVYFDTASSSLKPQLMINALTSFYTNNGISIRSQGFLSNNNILAIQQIRQKVASFIDAGFAEEIIFTKNTTDALNNLSYILAEQFIQPGDEIITSELEHNSSILPWIKIAKQKAAKLVFVPLNSQYQITTENFKKVLTKKTKIVALTHMSNVLGYLNPIKDITKLAHQKKNVIVILDAAQSIGHVPVNVRNLGIDFMAFSTHKMYGPFGLGILYGKKNFLKKLKPLIVGGGSVKDVEKNRFVLNDLPAKFEAGTPDIGSIIAFGKTLDLLQQIGFSQIQKYEKALLYKLTKQLNLFKNLEILNPLAINMINFNFSFIHSHDVETFLAQKNIYVRSGQHCAHLLFKNMKKSSTVRVSLGIHNNEKDIEILVENLYKIEKFFSRILTKKCKNNVLKVG
ncbi:MAG: aminotransferase class V-fold PLP-dependent enzyme [Vigna little leaf phytoplasma]|nr:aminotransferase class V-fold PLP-dependent enzyme [Vigna little leaf phytoplasma]